MIIVEFDIDLYRGHSVDCTWIMFTFIDSNFPFCSIVSRDGLVISVGEHQLPGSRLDSTNKLWLNHVTVISFSNNFQL